MNKQDLITRIANDTELTKQQAACALEAATTAITEALASGDSVLLVGFGSFSVAEREAREGRNPRTGETVHIPTRRVPKFVPGKALKDAVN